MVRLMDRNKPDSMTDTEQRFIWKELQQYDMEQEGLDEETIPPLFGPPEPQVAERLEWGDRTGYSGESSSQWITIKSESEVDLYEYR